MTYEEAVLLDDDGEPLEWVVQRRCGSPMLGSVQGQAGWSFELPDVERCPRPWQGVGLDDL